MLKTIVLAALAASLVVMGSPAEVHAYGAAHVGYTHVGPNGVYHTGATGVSGPGGTYGTSHTSAYGSGGGAYHSGSTTAVGAGGAYHAGYTSASGPGGAAGAAGGYHYSPSYGGAAYGESAHYGYVR